LSILDDSEKREIISTGPALFIEGIREGSRPAGKTIPLTSWFFSCITSSKIAIQTGKFNIDRIMDLGNIYDIELYKNEYYRNRFSRRMKWVAEQTGLDFKIENNVIISDVSRSDARKSFKHFLDVEYNYSITDNLKGKNFDAHSEVLMWHLLNDIYNFPRPVGYEKKLAYDLINEYNENTRTKDVWNIDGIENSTIYIDGLMRALLETKKFEVISVPDIGMMYSPPRFSDPDKRIFMSGPYANICRSILESAQRAPAWPVHFKDEINFAFVHLNSAGLVEYVSELDREMREYGYVIPRDYFWEIHVKLNYPFIDTNEDNKAETTLTEQIFRTVGRARLVSQILGRIELSIIDNKLKQLESGECKIDPIIKKILDPMMAKGSLDINLDKNEIFVVPGMENDVSIMLDVWQNMDLITLDIPEEEFAKQKRTAQTTRQFKKKAFKWLGIQ